MKNQFKGYLTSKQDYESGCFSPVHSSLTSPGNLRIVVFIQDWWSRKLNGNKVTDT